MSSVQRFFAGVPERRVTDVVNQGQSLDQVHVKAELAGDGAGNLRHLQRVSQPVAKMIGETAGKNLGLGLQPAESAGMNDPVAVALEIVAIGVLGLGNAASAGLLHPHGVVGQHRESLALGSAGILPAVGRASFDFAQDKPCPPIAVGGTPTGQPPGRRRYEVPSFKRISLVASNPRLS